MTNGPDFNTLPLFIATVEAGSFTAAAERLGCTKSRVSLKISALEKHLGVTLLSRTTRQVTLTEAGRQLYLDCQPWVTRLEEALSEAGTSGQTLSGTLRITAPTDHTAQSLAPAAAAFARLLPGLNIELRGDDKVADMVHEGIDLAIRMGWLKDSTLRAQKLGEFQQRILASPDYLRAMGTPAHPRELSQHRWIEFTLLPAPLTWWFSKGDEKLQVQMHSSFKVDSTGALLSLIRNGAGLSLLAHEPDPEDTGLVQLFPDWELPSGGIYAVFPPGAYIPAKVRAFVDFYRGWLA